MTNILRIEFKRAFSQYNIKLAILIGLMTCIAHCVLVFPIAYQSMLVELQSDYPLKNIITAYDIWICGNQGHITSYIYFVIIPIIATLPYGTSFFSDMKKGYINQLVTRVSKSKYLITKYFVCFILGGLVTILPLIFNLIIAGMIFPMTTPMVASSYTAIRSAQFFGDLFYTQPMLYVFIGLFIVFVYSGLLATFSLFASRYSNYEWMVLMTPFVLYLFLNSLFSLFDLYSWQPLMFLNLGYGIEEIVAVIIQIIGLALIGIYGFLFKENTYDC